MTTLPIPRYTGANTFTAQDAAGNIFYAYQASNADAGVLTMVDRAGVPHTITPAPVQGRPSLECNPYVGLWFVGNKETGSGQTPPRHKVKEYVPYEAPQEAPTAPQGGAPSLYPAVVVGKHNAATGAAHWSGQAFTGGVLVDIPALFGVNPANAYLIRLSGQAGVAGTIVRVGTQASPYFLTCVTQVGGIRVDTQGWVPGGGTWMSIPNGGSALVWLQLVGWSG